jgi:hypothetical protein
MSSRACALHAAESTHTTAAPHTAVPSRCEDDHSRTVEDDTAPANPPLLHLSTAGAG